MSPILDIQKRHATVYRIRLGDKDEKGHPRKLTDAVRITSPGRNIVEAFTDVYGGTVTEWEREWQAYLPTDHLRIFMLPGQSLTQYWERYKGAVCERRCDGYNEIKGGGPCLCPADIDARIADKTACAPMTRINVLCPDVAVVGSGALVTHSMIAAETLPQSIAIAEAALSRGLMVPAVLRIIEHRGRTQFIFPQLEIVGMSLNELTSETATSAGGGPSIMAVSGETQPPPAVTRPALPAPPPPLAEPRATVPPVDPKAPTIQRGAQLKAGDAPRELNARVANLDAEHLEVFAAVLQQKKLGMDDADADKYLKRVEDQQAAAHLTRQRKANAAMSELGITGDDERHQFMTDATGGATKSSGHLTAEQCEQIVTAAKGAR